MLRDLDLVGSVYTLREDKSLGEKGLYTWSGLWSQTAEWGTLVRFGLPLTGSLG